ncbi:MAG TPA: GH116 family glycosyl hydrolase, partial [Armatimonadota bacterium]|nr:GH116 family glycosyl hydrolase [Armatimonadota bacterium]
PRSFYRRSPLDVAPDLLIRLDGPSAALAELWAPHLAGARPATADDVPAKAVPPAGLSFTGLPAWTIARYVHLDGFAPSPDGLRVLATGPNGAPVLLGGTLGKAAVVLSLAEEMPWDWARRAVEYVRGARLNQGETIVPAAPTFGTMALGVDSASAVACASWNSPEVLAAHWRLRDAPAGPERTEPSPMGETHNAALCVPIMLEPGEAKSTTFTLAWHFPNVQRFDHFGNYYTRRFTSARAVAEYVAERLHGLWNRTELYHQTLYQSNLPEEFIDAMSSQSVIFRGPTCWWSEEGYFAGYEGCYGCCPLNCTHVWNYAQTHARLFPEIGRNLRVSDLITYIHPTGETSHRQHSPHGAFIDGHCAVIEATLREHQLSPDISFLRRVWPNVRKAVDWLIEAIDKDHDGVPAGHQWNTYDCAVSGPNTFIGSQYLSALAAGEKMAEAMGAPAIAARWRAIRMAGMANQDAQLWNGEYYIQIPENPPAHDYNGGCHSDQLLGQWWAHMLNLGYLFPRHRVRQALQSVMKYNMKDNFVGFTQAPRRYVPDDEGGLLMCTWPKGGRPDPFTIYSDEVWTGIEYATAGLMVYEGMIDEARRIVRTARSRYDGRLRPELNSGPGGNPFNELECGKFYARAMSSWSLLIACQGMVLDGPAGLIGFKPRWRPEDHRSFYTAPEGWGLFVQYREARRQVSRIDVRHGRLRVRELVVQAPPVAPAMRVHVRAGGRRVRVTASQQADEVRIRCPKWMTIPEGQEVEVELTW